MDWQELVQASEFLPKDVYAEGANRYRTLNRFFLEVLSPERALLQEDGSGAAYEQTKIYNPELGGIARDYPRSVVVCETNLVLREIVSAFAAVFCRITRATFPQRFDLNVHHVRYLAIPGAPSRNSPSGYHKDGERFISVHLLGRTDMVGGANKITGNDRRLLADFTLQRRGECFLIDDDRVWHSIEEMSAALGAAAGTRDILLIDYVPAST